MGRIVVRSVVSLVVLVAFVAATIEVVLVSGLEDRGIRIPVVTLLLTVVAVWIFMAPAWVLRTAKHAR